jgi:glutamine amidotransferase
LIAVLDYGIGNLSSAEKALRKVGAEAELCASAEAAEGAAGVVVPGVGAFGACMRALVGSGLAPVVEAAVHSHTPLLGICVGFQMLFECSEEDPEVAGLGILRGTVRRLPERVKRPQMQWNQLRRTPAGADSRMLDGLGPEPWVYFVHSYAPDPDPPADEAVVAFCDYGKQVVAAVERGPVWGCQFHPEKSGPTGLAILANFASYVAVAGTGNGGGAG